MGSISEQSRWVEDIYRIQKTDPVLGGQDGIINIQPEQMADRTVYLRDTLEKEHTPDGKHQITDSMVAVNADIPESKLDLKHGTADLKNDFTMAEAAMQRLKAQVEAVVGENGFFIEGLAQAVLLNWRYGEYGCDFEFFVDNLTMRDMQNIDARRAIARDDSVDCETTAGMQAGMCLMLYDDFDVEEVELRSVLERGRIRLTQDITGTFENDETCFIGYTNWDLSTTGKAVVSRNKFFYSRLTTILENCAYGSLLICRDKGAGRLKVWYRDADNSGQWLEAECDAIFPHDTDSTKKYEHYTIEGSRVQLKITCDSFEDVTVYHMALLPQPFALLSSSIRRPNVILPGLEYHEAWQDMLLFESSAFLSAYRDYYIQTEYGLFDAETDELIYTYSMRSNELIVVKDQDESKYAPAGEYVVRCRHQSDISEWSRWSKPVRMTLHKARILFGFDGAPKAHSFNYGEFDRLNFYPIRFGFAGARLSDGFGSSVAFTTKLED